MSTKKVAANIWKLYLIKSLSSMMFSIPIIVVFFQANGLTMRQVLSLQAIFSLSVILLEIPTGYFADIFGRKTSMIVGGLLATTGFSIYSQSAGFWGFLMAEIILGVGVSFTSGSDSAMLYESLFEIGKETEYKKAQGRGFGLGLFSEGMTSIIGGFLALVTLRFPFYFDILTYALVVPVALTLFEPKRKLNNGAKNDWRKMLRIVRFALHEQMEVKWLIIYSATVGASTLTMFWLTQPYLEATHVPLGLFGTALAIFLFCAAIFSWNAHRIEAFLGKKTALVLLLILPSIGYALLSSVWVVWSGVFILLFYAARGINNPITLDYINGLISSDNRATVLSVKNLAVRIIFSIVGPLAGWANDACSLRFALLFSGAIFLILGMVSLVFLKKHNAL